MKKLLILLLFMTTSLMAQSLGGDSYFTKGNSYWTLTGTDLVPSTAISLRLNATTTNYHTLTLGASSATNLNGFNFVNTNVNRTRTSLAQATDTSSVSLSFLASGKPIVNIKGATGNTVLSIDSTGMAGIGVTASTAMLHVGGGDYGIAAEVAYAGTEVTGNYSLNIVNSNTTTDNRSNIWFADVANSASAIIGAVHTNHSSNYADLTFSTRGDGSGVTDRMRITSLGKIIIGDLTTDERVVTLADSASITIATSVAGWGRVMIGDNQEEAEIKWTSAGAVTLIRNSTNVANDGTTDNTLNIYDGGSGIIIKNLLGTSLKCAISLKYYTP